MMLSIMVVGAGAAFADQSDIDTKHQQAVDMCSSLNIIVGFDNGKFMPNESVTREQMAKMICILDNGGKEPQLATGNTFSDVAADRWSNKYIEACASRGVVVGIGGGKFAPAGKVTATQAAKMLLVELGYDDDLQQYSGSDWATKVNVDATKKGYYEDLEDIDVNAPLTREHAAQMVWNALQANEVDYTYTLVTNPDGSISSKVTVDDKLVAGDPISLMADKYGLNDEHHGIMVGFNYNSTKEEWTYNLKEDKGIKSYKSSTDYTDLFQQDVTVAYKEKDNGSVDSVYGMFVDKDDCQVLVTGLVGDMNDVSAASKTVKVDGTEYDLQGKKGSAVDVYFFQHVDVATPIGSLSQFADKNQKSLDAFEFTAIDLDSDDDIDTVVVYPFAVGQVNLLNASKIGVKNLNSSEAANISKDTETADLKDVTVYDGVAKDDFVIYTPAVYTATNDTTIVKADTVLEGSVSRVSGTDVTIDGTMYTNYTNKSDLFGAGAKVKDTVVVNGYIFLADSTGAVDVDDYAVIIAMADGSNSVNGAQAKLLMSDGSKKVVDLKDAGGNKMGDLVTFSKNSSDEYTLTKAITDKSKASDAGFDSIPAVNVEKIEGKNNVDGAKIKRIENTDISDTATIFVYENDSDTYKVINGAQLKKTAAAGVSVVVAYASDNSKTNYSTIELAYVKTDTDLISGDTQYAYVLSDAATVENTDGDKVTELTLWNGKEKVTLNAADNTTFKNVKEGQMLAYTVNTDGELDTIVAKANDPLQTPHAIGSYDGTYVTFANMTGSNRFEVTKDTIIFYIDADAVEGFTNGDIQIAQDMESGSKYNNCFFYSEDKDELDVLVVDVNNDIENKL